MSPLKFEQTLRYGDGSRQTGDPVANLLTPLALILPASTDLKDLFQARPVGVAFEFRRDPNGSDLQTSMLLLALAAILSNHVSELAIAQWGAGQSDEVKKALGFEKGVTPHQTTMQRLFRKMNGEELEAAFRGIFVQMCEQNKQDRGAWAVAIDGKAQK